MNLTWKEPIPTFSLEIVELPPKLRRTWWNVMKNIKKKSGYHHAKKIWEECRLLHKCSWIAINAQCRDVCVCVTVCVTVCVCTEWLQIVGASSKEKLWCEDAPTNRATFRMPRKQTLKPNNQPTSNNDSTSHQSKARFWTFISSPPLAMGAKTNGASRFTAAFLSWSWLLTYAEYGFRMPNVATLASDLMEIGNFVALTSLWSPDCTYDYTYVLCHPWFRITYSPHSATLPRNRVPMEKWHAATQTNCLWGWHHVVGYVFSLRCILAYDPHFYTALSKSTGKRKVPLCPLWAH